MIQQALGQISPPPFDSYSFSSSQEGVEVKRRRLGEISGDDQETPGPGGYDAIELLKLEIELVSDLVSIAEREHIELEAYLRTIVNST